MKKLEHKSLMATGIIIFFGFVYLVGRKDGKKEADKELKMLLETNIPKDQRKSPNKFGVIATMQYEKSGDVAMNLSSIDEIKEGGLLCLQSLKNKDLQ